jgi:NAD(P)-dependent dehydrogenase (short-subunit alcohol dehydrogenase family)
LAEAAIRRGSPVIKPGSNDYERGERAMPDDTMLDKICMVTGATSGIGLVTARALARQGAHVVVVGRHLERTNRVVEQIQVSTGNARVEPMIADLSVQAQVRSLAAAFNGRYQRLDVLVNNAGGFFMRRQLSADGIEMTWALNYLSVFLLTNLLLDPLKAATPSRIVNVSSDTQRSARLEFDDLQRAKRYNGLAAYAQSKLAVILFTYELARRLEGTGVTANAVHPGWVATNIYAGSGGVVKLVAPLIRLFAVNPEEGAQTSIYLASSPEVEGVTGKYFYKCKEAPTNPIALDLAVAEKLWQVSLELSSQAA